MSSVCFWLREEICSTFRCDESRVVHRVARGEREFIIGNLLVRIHFIVETTWRTGLAPWQCEFPFLSTFQGRVAHNLRHGLGAARATARQKLAAESVYRVVLQRSIAAHIRRLVLYHYYLKEQVDRFVRESTFANRLCERFL